MDRIEFLQAIFNFFRIDVSKNEQLLTQYDLALSTKERIDWQKLYNLTLREIETRTLPTPKWFRDKFYRCIKQDGFNFHENDGTKVIVEFLDGYTYEFELYNCTLSRAEILRGLNNKFFKNETDENGKMKRVSKVKNVRFIKEEESEDGNKIGDSGRCIA